jgi:hypothetical protein
MTVYEEIRHERRRQRHGEGFGDEHDDAHTDGSLAQAAACYAWGPAGSGSVGRFGEPSWPISWAAAWDKRLKHSRRRQLVISAALIVAEIQRLDRAGGQAVPLSAPLASSPVWHIVELYGHRRLAGQVSQASFPEGFVQINTVQGPTQIYNPKAVFSLAPVTERSARAAAAKCCDDPVPIKPWESGEGQRIEALRAALGKVARGEVSPAIDLAREALAADDAASDSSDESECPI